MTPKTRKALKMAQQWIDYEAGSLAETSEAITEALAEPEPTSKFVAAQEPIGPEFAKALHDNLDALYETEPACTACGGTKAVYGGEVCKFCEEPAPRRLTDEEIDDIWATTAHSNHVFARAIEARIFGDVK